jgi:hypothetical protein
MRTLNSKPLIMFDTLAYAKKFISVGLTEAQVEAHAETLTALPTEQLTTKIDLAELDNSLTLRMIELETNLKSGLIEPEPSLKDTINDMGLRLEAKIENTKSETIKWVAAMLVAQSAIIAAMIKLI